MSQSERYQRFEAIYRGDDTPPWDSGIVPPELRALIEAADGPAAGRALDAGCGTGTNVIYLGQQGWQVTGVEWIAEALDLARCKAAAAHLDAEQVQFVQSSVATPDLLPDHAPVDLWLDIGCLHSLDAAEQHHYAANVQRLVAPGGHVLIYAWLPTCATDGPRGLTIDEFSAWLGPDFELVETVTGAEATNDSIASAWHLLHRH